MRFIYKTDNPIEAHIITHMLEQHGIMAQVIEDHPSHKGHFIGGGILGGAVARISVIDDEAEEAEKLIKEWEEKKEEEQGEQESEEQESPTLEDYKPAKPPSYLIPKVNKEIVSWIILCASLMWFILRRFM